MGKQQARAEAAERAFEHHKGRGAVRAWTRLNGGAGYRWSVETSRATVSLASLGEADAFCAALAAGEQAADAGGKVIAELMARARLESTAVLCAALEALGPVAGLGDAGKRTRAVLMDVLCERHPKAEAASQAWEHNIDGDRDGHTRAVVAAVRASDRRQTEAERQAAQARARRWLAA